MKKRFATYSEENGLKLTSNHGLFERRADLKGKVFKAVVAEDPPFISSVKTAKNGSLVPSGLFVDVMDILSQRLNFRIQYQAVSSSWSSMVDLVGNGTYDLSLAAFILSFERSFLVDFSFPLLRTSVKIFYKRVNSDFGEPLDFVTFFRPFRTDLWLAVLVYYAAIFTAFCILEAAAAKAALNDCIRQSSKTTFMAALGKNPGDDGKDVKRYCLVLVSLAGFFTLSVYRAMLGASLAITKEVKPFSSLEDIADSSHRVLVYPNGFQHGLLARAAPGSPLNRLYVNNVDLKPMSTSVAIEAILNGTLENTLTMKNDLPVMQLPHWPCAIDALDIVLHRFANGYVFSKNWPYTDLVNHHLKKLVLETGVYKRIRDQVISHASNAKVCRNKVAPADFNEVVSVYMLLAAGFVASMVVLVFEKAANPD